MKTIKLRIGEGPSGVVTAIRPDIQPGTRVRGALYPGDLRWRAGEPGKPYEATFMAWDAEGDAAVDIDGEVTYLQGETVEALS